MDRDEILRRSREEKNDEMEIQVRDKAMKWTYIALVLSAAFFSLIRGMHDQPIMDPVPRFAYRSARGAFTATSRRGINSTSSWPLSRSLSPSQRPCAFSWVTEHGGKTDT